MNTEAIPLDQIDVSDPNLYADDSIHAQFARLRQESPVPFCAVSNYGPVWSMTE